MSGMGDNFSNMETSGDIAKVVSQQIVYMKKPTFLMYIMVMKNVRYGR